jgi:hypothetical protein
MTSMALEDTTIESFLTPSVNACTVSGVWKVSCDSSVPAISFYNTPSSRFVSLREKVGDLPFLSILGKERLFPLPNRGYKIDFFHGLFIWDTSKKSW